MDPLYAERQEDREMMRKMVMGVFQPMLILFAEEEKGKKTHGYRTMKKAFERFHLPLNVPLVYYNLNQLEEKGLFESTHVISDESGHPRREYHTVEPQASRYCKRFLKIKKEFDSAFDDIVKNIESNDSSVQVSVALPEAMAAIRLENWRERAAND